MYLFLIEKSNVDFCCETKTAIEYKNWLSRDSANIEYVEVEAGDMAAVFRKYAPLISSFEAVIPVGAIPFVEEFYKICYGISLPPALNIPKELFLEMYVSRSFYKVWTNQKDILWSTVLGTKTRKTTVSGHSYLFCKANKAKAFASLGRVKDIIEEADRKNIDLADCVFSDKLDIASEYRCFVLEGKLLDCRCYAGDFKKHPDFELIESMIAKYSSEKAYTLDVAVTADYKTVLLECHDFYSCGLYGFSNPCALIKMLLITHRKIISQS